MLAYKCGCVQVGMQTEFCDEHREGLGSSPTTDDRLALELKIWNGPQVRVCVDCSRYEPQVKFDWGQPWCDECQEIRKARSIINNLEVNVAEDIGSGEGV